MAKILVVDDNTINRKLLVALLSHDGHLTTEASDGAEALDVALAERPQLVISDIVMPTTDGFEFVRALRADADLRGTPVIFYTANYHEREALNLAQACQVARVLVKPCPPLEILKAVDQVMAGVSESGRFFIPESFDREHLVLMTNKLAEQSDALAASNARLVALGILNVELAADRDSKALLRRVCGGARNLIGAQGSGIDAGRFRRHQRHRSRLTAAVAPDRIRTPGGCAGGSAVLAQPRGRAARPRLSAGISAGTGVSRRSLVHAHALARLAVPGRQNRRGRLQRGG